MKVINYLFLAFCSFAVTSPSFAQDYTPEDGEYLLQYCKGPRMSYKVKKKRITGHVDVLFDISEDGKTNNIRIANAANSQAFNKSVIKALSAWRYYAYQNNGEIAPRQNVKLTFSFHEYAGLNNDQSCLKSYLPEGPTTVGDPASPQVAIKSCHNLAMPKKYDKRKTYSKTSIQYDISKTGKVSNISIISNGYTSIFDQTAKNALSLMRYQKFFKAGKPIARSGVVAHFTFGTYDGKEDKHSCFHADYGSSL